MDFGGNKTRYLVIVENVTTGQGRKKYYVLAKNEYEAEKSVTRSSIPKLDQKDWKVTRVSRDEGKE